jgi:hypothetical protein
MKAHLFILKIEMSNSLEIAPPYTFLRGTVPEDLGCVMNVNLDPFTAYWNPPLRLKLGHLEKQRNLCLEAPEIVQLQDGDDRLYDFCSRSRRITELADINISTFAESPYPHRSPSKPAD